MLINRYECYNFRISGIPPPPPPPIQLPTIVYCLNICRIQSFRIVLGIDLSVLFIKTLPEFGTPIPLFELFWELNLSILFIATSPEFGTPISLFEMFGKLNVSKNQDPILFIKIVKDSISQFIQFYT